MLSITLMSAALAFEAEANPASCALPYMAWDVDPEVEAIELGDLLRDDGDRGGLSQRLQPVPLAP